MSEKLRPCPFCGSENVKLRSGNWEGYVACLDCRAEGPHVVDISTQERDEIAAELWGAGTTDGDALEKAKVALHEGELSGQVDYQLPDFVLEALTPTFLYGFSVAICSLFNWKQEELTPDNVKTIEGCGTWQEAFQATCYIHDKPDLLDYFNYTLSDGDYDDFCAQVDTMMLDALG